MSKPFFSIIIPTLNEAQYLPLLLEDLTEQSFRDFEVIVVDGKSNDQTIQKARAFKTKLPSLKIITSQKRHVCTQRNFGAKHARADIFIFMDADNRLPSWFLQGIKYRTETESADILSPYIDPPDHLASSKAITNAVNLYMDLQMQIKPTHLLESCLIIKKGCFNHIGGFDEQVNFAEGNVLLEKAISLGYKMAVIKDPSYIFSFRRFKKYGTAKVISNAVSLQLMDLLGVNMSQVNTPHLYPMLGGSVYNTKLKVQKNKVTKYLKNIAKIFQDF